MANDTTDKTDWSKIIYIKVDYKKLKKQQFFRDMNKRLESGQNGE